MTGLGGAGVGRVNASQFHYRACLALLFVGYCASFFLHKYKLYYFGWAACLLITTTMVLTGKLRLRLTPRHIGALAVFYAYLALTALWSYSPSETVYYVVADLLQPVAFVMGIVWAQNNPPRRLSEYIPMFVSAHILIAIVLMVASGGFFFDQYGSIRSALGLALVTGLPMLIWRAKLQRTVVRAVLPALAVLIILVLGSRAALALAAPVLVASFYSVSEGRLRFIRATARFGVLGLLGALVIWSVPGLRHGAEAALSRFGPDNLSFAITPGGTTGLLTDEIQADLDRRLQAAVALGSFLNRPLTGGGYMSTLSITTAAYGRVGLSAHGLPFTLLGETGLIGTAIFLWFLLGCYRSVRRRLASPLPGTDASFHRILLVTLGAMLLFGVFHQIHQVPSFFVLLGWGYAADRKALAPIGQLVPDSTAPEPLPTH
jgi:hypothetical protein